MVHFLTRSLQHLARQMEEAGKGDLKTRLQEKGCYETRLLARCYNSMISQIDDLIKKNYVMTLNEKTSRLQALESIINPHFLYNSLQVISSRTLLTGDRQLYKMIEALAANLRYSFREASLVPITLEADYVQNYLLLLRARFDERLTTSIKIEPEVKPLLIPKLALFTLIENSIAHGLESSMKQVNIQLLGEKKGNTLLLSVTDNGPGFSSSRLAEILSWLNTGSSENYGDHIGLRNLNARLKLYFGEEERSRLFLSQLLSHAALKENYHCYIESPHLLILGVEVLNSPFINFSKSYVEAKIQENVRNILNMFQKSHDFFTVAGMGQFVEPNITALKASYEQAVLISSKLNLYSSETLISHEYTAKSLSHLDYLSPKKELIMRALGKWDEKNLCRILNQHFSAILEKDHVTLELLSYNAMELLIIFQEFSREYQIPQYQELLAPLADLKELKEINSIKEFNDFFCSLFAQLGAYAQRNTQPTILNILSEIKSCIEEEYSRNLTLTYFSEKYHLTKEYLSKQFKEQYAYSIYEYLLSYRMEKAKELLSATDMKIQSVSDHVGYTDTNYFSKAFKTYCGISPREYRQQFGKSITKF